MAEMKIGNTVIDTLNHKELHDSLSRTQTNWFQEMARGVKHLQLPTAIATIANSAVTLPAVGGTNIGPKMGFSWAIQRISCANISGSDVIKIYRNTVNDMGFVGILTATAPVIFPGETGLILQDNDNLVFSGTSLSGTGDIVVTGEVIELPSSDIWKILGS